MGWALCDLAGDVLGGMLASQGSGGHSVSGGLSCAQGVSRPLRSGWDAEGKDC